MTLENIDDDGRTQREIYRRNTFKNFEERFTLVGNFHASECPFKKEEKMLGNHLECPRTYLGTVGIDKSR